MVVDIGTREVATGSLYVAFSRVKRLQDLAITEAFNYSRVSRIGASATAIAREQFLTEKEHPRGDSLDRWCGALQ